jgi:hypothetical protein
MSLACWCLHNIFLSWCSSKDIGVSSRLVPKRFMIIGWCIHTFIKIIFCGFLPQGIPN